MDRLKRLKRLIMSLLISTFVATLVTPNLFVGNVEAQMFDPHILENEDFQNSEIVSAPFGWQSGEIQTGEWAVHRVGWIATTEQYVQDFLDSVEVTFFIDGTPIEHANQYFGPISYSHEFGVYFTYWFYEIHPQKPGVHTLRYTWTFKTLFTDGLDLDYDGNLDWYGPGGDPGRTGPFISDLDVEFVVGNPVKEIRVRVP